MIVNKMLTAFNSNRVVVLPLPAHCRKRTRTGASRRSTSHTASPLFLTPRLYENVRPIDANDLRIVKKNCGVQRGRSIVILLPLTWPCLENEYQMRLFHDTLRFQKDSYRSLRIHCGCFPSAWRIIVANHMLHDFVFCGGLGKMYDGICIKYGSTVDTRMHRA